jgi:hypothetical protein
VQYRADPIPAAFACGRVEHDLAGARGDIELETTRIVEQDTMQRPMRRERFRDRPLIALEGLDV